MKTIFLIMYFILVISEFKSYMTKNLRNDFFKNSEVSKDKFTTPVTRAPSGRSIFGKSICPEGCKFIYNGHSYECVCKK